MTGTPNNPNQYAPRFDPSLGDLIAIMWQRRGVTLLACVVTLLSGLITVGQWQSEYRAVAEVGLTLPVDVPQPSAIQAQPSRTGQVTAQEIETLIAEMKSQDVLSAALAVLRGDDVWNAGQSPSTISETTMIDTLRAGLEANRIGNAAVLEISYHSISPDLGQTVLQTIIESHVWWREGRQKQYLRHRAQEVEAQYQTAQAELAKREETLTSWQRDAGVLDEQESKMMLARIYALDEQAEEIGHELIAARVARDHGADLQKLSDLLAMPDVAGNPIVSQLAKRFDELRSEYVTLDQRYGPKHPVMQSKSRELDTLHSELFTAARSAVDRVVQQLDLKVAGASGKLKLVTQQRDQWHDRMTERHDRMQGQAALLRAVEMARADVLELGQKSQSLQRDLVAFRGDVEILRPATAATTAEFPNKRDLVLMVVFIAMFGSVGAALLRHYFDQTIDDGFDAETTLGIHLFASIPDMESPDGGHEAIGHLAVLMRILHQEKATPADHRQTAQLIAMGSAVTGEGKSHISRLLAGVLAGFGGRVLLINADLHDPGPLEAVGDGGRDLTAVLSGDCAFEDAIIGGQGGAYDQLGPAFAVPGTMATRLIETRLADVLAKLRDRYDHIIIDTPPILSVADAIVAFRQADVGLFAVRCGYSKRRDIADAINQLRAVGVRPNGVVMNGARPRAAYGAVPSSIAPAERMS